MVPSLQEANHLIVVESTIVCYSERMITSSAEFVRLRVSERAEEYQRAANEEAPDAVWLEIILRYPSMRRWVAHNKTIPLDILRLLATDKSPTVRSAVASKRKLDAKLFEQLAQDSDEGVRASAASNAKAPRHLLEELSRDSVSFVAEAARQRL